MQPATEDEIKVCFNARTKVKGALTRIRTFLTTFNKRTQSVEQLWVRQRQFADIWEKYDTNQSVLETDDPETHERDRETFENLFFDTQAQVEKLINDMQGIRPGPVTNTTPSIEQAPVQRSVNVKLPQIDLPSFTGKYEDWRSFIDIFDSMVHENESLRDVQKLQYLKMSVVGDAGALIQSLKSTGDHYQKARNILFENFDKRQYIVEAHLSALLNHDINVKHELRKLVSHCTQQINALNALELSDNELWEQTIIFIIKQKLNFRLCQEWELENKDKNTLPRLDNLLKFMDSRCFESNKSREQQPKVLRGTKCLHAAVDNTSRSYQGNKSTCAFCKADNHQIFQCPQVLDKPVDERIATVKALNLCLNCLRTGHKVQQCKSRGCKQCNKKHNSLLHLPERNSQTNSSPSATVSQGSNIQNSTQSYICQGRTQPNSVLLGTAVILVMDSEQKWVSCRVLLDSGSQSNFTTQSFLSKLNHNVNSADIAVLGVNQVKTKAKGTTTLYIKSRVNDFVHRLDFVVLPQVTVRLPEKSISAHSWRIPSNLQLADPQFQQSGEIDMLIGAELYFEILGMEQIRLGDDLPILQQTEFGWIISGKINNCNENKTVCCTTTTTLEDQLVKFWSLEELSAKPKLTADEKLVETHFEETHLRDELGRFIVQLPKQLDSNLLGDSYKTAYERFLKLETRFKRDHLLKERYTNFIEEYKCLDHMEEISNIHEIQNGPKYYLPHHAVIKESRITSKIRVVFDASARTSSGLSLNDILMIGPTIQDDIFTLLTRFRQHKYVLTSDIVKMYRQVRVCQPDANLQLILWRENPDDTLKTFRLKTVTYGTASAPFLAIRCLQEVGAGSNDSKVQRTILEDFYVDDMLTGSDNLDELLQIRDQVIHLLSQGGFTLDKWGSNNQLLLDGLSSTTSVIIFDKSDTIKTLGLHWRPQQDTFCFQIPEINPTNMPLTKRDILSTISKIFDPLGLLSPIIIKAKMVMQQLWELRTPWDEVVPSEIQSKWNQFCSELPLLSNLRISRHAIIDNAINIELHGFADASEVAYGAVIYLQSTNYDGQIQISLIASKGRVAPLKRTTLPRLELCAAHLLARLYNKIIRSFVALPITSSHMWSDSTIVLCWLQKSSRNLKTFVAARVAEIQELTSQCQWKHVISSDNPADVVSRGITPKEMLDCSIWWSGPSWLLKAELTPHQQIDLTDDESVKQEMKNTTTNFATTIPHSPEFLTKFSSFTKLKRTIAYCQRFYHNLKYRENKMSNHLTTEELNKALCSIIFLVQRESFSSEIDQLKVNGMVKKGSKLAKLHPFLDNNGLLRVGGRLQHSSLSSNQKHPLLLPRDHHVSRIIVKEEHIKRFHCGYEQLTHSVRQRFWILSCRRLVKKVINQCINCFRLNPRPANQFMGNLPSHRVTPSLRPFINCGLDYAGPIQLRESRRRGRIPVTKAYIALFICLSTKAIHIELVSSLTTKDFFAAFKRFIGRRGLCRNVYSDNGTTFVGAHNQLKDLYKFIQEHSKEIGNFFCHHEVDWHYTPARSPHFGGIWEANIKSTKRSLNRVTQGRIQTYEEYSTLLIGIESCLNSRPLTPCSTDPSDLSVLTPSHFILGDLMLEPVELDLTTTKPSSLVCRWKQLTQIRQQFWKRWQREYLQELQTRHKWYVRKENLVPGLMVLLMEDNLPPLQWAIGRIEATHPGSDGITRVVSVRTVKGLYKRAVTKVCVLPFDGTIKENKDD